MDTGEMVLVLKDDNVTSMLLSLTEDKQIEKVLNKAKTITRFTSDNTVFKWSYGSFYIHGKGESRLLDYINKAFKPEDYLYVYIGSSFLSDFIQKGTLNSDFDVSVKISLSVC